MHTAVSARGVAAIMHVVGTRPNFVKAAPVVRALADRGVEPMVVHTGQHYDALLSDALFTELDLPEPVDNLGVGSGSHAQQTAALLIGLEEVMVRRDPDLVVVYGDVNSTMAAALVAAKLRIPVVHVESGLRSFDDDMPEEINRRITDQLASLLLTTSADADENLQREGRAADQIRLVGNTMIDSLERARPALDPDGAARAAGIVGRDWVLVTLHRPSNVDDPDRSTALVGHLNDLAERAPVILPLHPRTRARWVQAGVSPSPRVAVIDPLPYGQFLSFLAGARLVITDSGGVQEESTVLGVPCLTVRRSTERPVTVTEGTNRLVDVAGLTSAALAALADESPATPRRPPLWDGRAGERAADAILDFARSLRKAR